MSLELNPVGMACNIACEYCYEQPMRDAGNVSDKLDLDAVFKTLDTYNEPFSLFGGEPLLLSLDKLETIFQHGYNRWKLNGVQTNGILITDSHLELFKKYNVHVGFSIDGPYPINRVRCNEELTNKSIVNMYRCLTGGISTSLIFTVQAETINNQGLFIEWLRDLDDRGLRSARIHLLEADNNVERPDKDSLLFFLQGLEVIEPNFKNLKFDIFHEIYMLLQNPEANVTCVWNACDPYTTAAVQGVGPSGQLYNCGRTNKEGVQWHKAKEAGHERQRILYHTDCKGCKFFLACKGYCPGTAIDGDWRRKTEHCEVLYSLFERAEKELHRVRVKTYTQSCNLKEMEMAYLDKLDGKTRCVGSEQHSDWHIDTNAKIAYTGNIPVRKP